ncbi:unnamed protein product [Blepharisma stoltei]|uniref:Uncharacterized protein n=1 Tax=Blepharisma stoltei TaxID=1481888 RepID=A0AAU9IS81_9CILI|nr:unnamed protein product [Blepharisma stoltei]
MSEQLGSLETYFGTPIFELSQFLQTNKNVFTPRSTFCNDYSFSKETTRPSTQKRNSMLGRIDLSSREYDSSPRGSIYQNSIKDIEPFLKASTRAYTTSRPRHRRSSNSEDYAHIKSKINSLKNPYEIRAVSPTQIQLKDKVRNELQMGNYHHLIRSMRKALREDEQKINQRAHVNISAFERLAKNFGSKKVNVLPPKVKYQKDEDGVIRNQEEARYMTINIAMIKWLKKRGSSNEGGLAYLK